MLPRLLRALRFDMPTRERRTYKAD